MSKFPGNGLFDVGNPSAKAEHTRLSTLDAKALLALVAALQERADVDSEFIEDAMRAVEVLCMRTAALQKTAPAGADKGLFAQITALYRRIGRKRSYKPEMSFKSVSQ